jgi:hypothetical protein
MKKATNNPIVKRSSLQHLMNALVAKTIPAARHNQSCVLNEIGKEIVIDGNNQKLISLISELLETVVTNSHQGEIHISADRFSDVVILSIQERNNYNGYALSYSVSSMENAAMSVGGHISIKGPQQKVATVSFSFPAQIAAA